ncbi:accessory Sec system glycosyltransferase Asp1 [Lentilactobacillus hilgardii]|nr:accessory Sec system glycosyltransferase Asp1 [Lentilactobacillus hilgardii]MCV3739948.1 accessory Sec system glycosyltransferase Asp1 [Lentilactobacillus hilgardii]
MYYFVNEYLYDKNSGIEHTELKRLALFKSMHVAAKLVLREYNPQLHRIMAKFGLEKQDVINMFDYFQGVVDADTGKAKIEDVRVNPHYEVDPDPTISKVFRGNLLANRVIFIAGTYGQVGLEEYFDRYQSFVRADQWDWRGFKSSVKYYDADRKVIREEYLNLDGDVVLVAAYGGEGAAQQDMTYIRLVNYHGEDYFFYNIDELFGFFLSELDKRETPGENTFIADRPLTTYQAVMTIPGHSRKYIYLPMVQTDQVNKDNQSYVLVIGKLNEIYQYAFAKENIGRLSGIIVGTTAQQKDIAERLKKQVGVEVPVLALPAATVSGPHEVTTDRKDQIVYVGRLGTGKGIVRLVDTFKLIHNDLTNLHLLIYGYGEEEKQAKEEAKKLGIGDAVEFKGYQVDLSEAYASSKLFITATTTDVEPLAMTEAASYGLPMVAFNVAYGPSEIIHDGWNGLIFKDGEVKEMAAGVVALLKDPDRLRDYSQNALKTAAKFSHQEVAKRWQQEVINQQAANATEH